jgi:DNA-binding NarL/FixJ family response regulator
VLANAVLPDGDWRRVLEIVAYTCPNIEVVVSSRLGDHKLVDRCPGAGAYMYWSSPTSLKGYGELSKLQPADRRYMRSLPLAQAISYKPKAARAAGAA